MSSNKRNRREHERATVELMVACEVDNWCQYTTATNLSEEGLFVATRAPEPPGNRIDLHFALPGEDALQALKGEVMWADDSGHDPGMGIQFVGLDPTQRARLCGAVQRLTQN